MKYAGLMLLAFLLLVGCSSDNEAEVSGESSEDEANDWEETVNTYETTEELYEKAKEEGEVVVYSATSAVEKVGLAFEEAFPGVTASVTKVSDADIAEKIRRESESGVNHADIIFGKGTNGVWANELLPEGILYSYKPEEIMESIEEPYSEYDGLALITEIITVLYNTEAYDAPPIDNWWDLTKPEWEGKILMKDPLSAADIQALFMAMVKHSDDMEAAYEEEFGEPLELNGTENAGYEFIKRLMDNDVILMSSMGDTTDAVAESTGEDSPLVIASTVKLRDVVDKDAPLDMIQDLKPKTSVPGTSKVYMVNEAENVHAAKLFIRFMAGGEDGQGEGFDFFNNPGTFATRTVIEQDNWLPSINDMNVWEEDETYNYENAEEMRNFLLKVQ